MTAVATSLFASEAVADVCATPSSFTDVAQTDFFCTHAEWMRNRGVTVGCAPGGTLYCPSDPVTRGQMAAFMNRLGLVVTPTSLSSSGNYGVSNIPVNQSTTYCHTAVQASANFPRLARARGYVKINSSGGGFNMFMAVSRGGAPYEDMGVHRVSLVNPAGERFLSWASNTNATASTIAPGQTTQFAIGIAVPPSVASPLNVISVECTLEAELLNANPSAPPFDE
ncbi:MAG TPA: S-layer homology domain-containing protein [Casimicrobiaceae bacterium]|nr:S-layer homology domain-containing protein [Casimicrobiaceae bacterium]